MLFYLTLTCLLFLFLVIIIALFGSIFYSFFNKRSKTMWDHNVLEKFFLSFGFGLSIYLPICFIISSLRIVSFFTILIPFILIDIILTIVLLVKKKISLKKYYSYTIESLKKREIRIFLIIIFLFLIIQFFYQISVILSYLALPSTDPYLWYSRISQLLRDNQFTEFGPAYPQGYNLFCSAALSIFIIPDFHTTYFFLKYATIPFFSLYIIIMAIIIRRIFKKNYFVLFGLIITSCSFHLIYRFLCQGFIPSNLAILLFLISLLLLSTDTHFYLNAFFFIGIYLLNPIIALFYLISLIIFVLPKFFYIKNRGKIFIKDLVRFLLLASILLIPYIIFITSYGLSIFSILDFIFGQFETQTFIALNNSILAEPNLFYFIDESSYFYDVFFNYNLIFSFIFFLSLVGLFLPLRKNIKPKFYSIIIFGKGIIILVLLFFIIPIFIPNFILIKFIPFWISFRLLEIMSAPLIIMSCFTLSFLLKKAKLFTVYLMEYSKKYRKIINKNKFSSKLVRIEKILVLILIISSFSYYYKANYQDMYNWNGCFKHNDLFLESIFFIKGDITSGEEILVPNFTRSVDNTIYNLLYDYNFTLWDYYLNQSYYLTIYLLNKTNTNYCFLSFRLINSDQLVLFLNDSTNFIIIYENSENVILEFIENN